VKVYSGHDGGSKTVIVDLLQHGRRRTFDIGRASTSRRGSCRRRSSTTARSARSPRTTSRRPTTAPSYYFGETVDTYEDGVVTGHEGSWLVGGPTDPGEIRPERRPAAAPNVFMPANPEVDDVFKPEDTLPVVDETDTVKDVGLTVQDPGREVPRARSGSSSPSSLDSGTETKWYARASAWSRGRRRARASR
jgi:hypothetical protein